MNRRFEILSFVVFFATVAVLSIFSVVSLDIGFHLGAGAYIFEHASIPTHDPFSFIAEGRRWIDSHWLFQVLLHAVYAIAGAPGLVLLRVAVVVGIFVLLLLVSRRRAGVSISLLVALLVLFVSYQRFIIRPELLSLLFLAIFIHGVDSFSRHPKHYLVLLPLVQVIWANAHGLYVLGLGYLGLHLLGGVVADLAYRRGSRNHAPEMDSGERKQKALLLGLCVAAALVNANGLAGILYPVNLLMELAGGVSWFPQVIELISPLSYAVASPLQPELFYWILVLLSLGAVIANWRNSRLSDLLPYLAFLLLSLRSVRNTPLFALVAMPLTAGNLRAIGLAALERGWVRRPAQRVVAIGLAVSMLLLFGGLSVMAVSDVLYQSLGWQRRFGAAESQFYPSGVVERLRKIDGRFFNDSSMGGYLIWKLYPEKQVATDGRWEVYGDLLPRLAAAMEGPRRFSELSRRHDIGAIVLMRRSADSRVMLRWLSKSREFELTLRTPNALLFEKREKRARAGQPARSSPSVSGPVKREKGE